MTFRPPRVIGSVKILERLGEGGMAIVHRAEDVYRPELQLAVKFLRPEMGQDADLVRRFLREGEILKRLRHPHLVEVLDFGRSGSTPYLLMELLPGGSVKACLGEPPSRLLRRLVPVLDALFHAHENGVIHRDLKPSNLLFAADGRLKVTDFGVSLWEGGEGTRVTRSQMVVGTLGYMAPEQHGDPRKVDGRCDVYAMGALLYEFCTGQPYSQVQLPPASLRPGFPPGLAGLIMQALAPDPARRTGSMALLRDQVSAWLERAEAAAWGEEPLPGYRLEDHDQPTVTAVKPKAHAGSSEERLAPYLDALQTGGVGSRRAAAEGLRRSARPEDEAYLLEALAQSPDAARFAVVVALGQVGSAAALPALLAGLNDPFIRAESAESASLVAARTDRGHEVLAALHEAGLGSPWRWSARARLGDPAWVQAFVENWQALPAPSKLQALAAAAHLPVQEKAIARQHTAAEAQRAGGHLKEAWEALS
ncbi:MAG: serine/threonine protein kinase [Firmicutes bacterium]|nr:serine/threonine protein kinase [Bacillota bacterium]